MSIMAKLTTWVKHTALVAVYMHYASPFKRTSTPGRRRCGPTSLPASSRLLCDFSYISAIVALESISQEHISLKVPNFVTPQLGSPFQGAPILTAGSAHCHQDSAICPRNGLFWIHLPPKLQPSPEGCRNRQN